MRGRAACTTWVQLLAAKIPPFPLQPAIQQRVGTKPKPALTALLPMPPYVLQLGLDAAGKTTVLYKLKLVRSFP